MQQYYTAMYVAMGSSSSQEELHGVWLPCSTPCTSLRDFVIVVFNFYKSRDRNKSSTWLDAAESGKRLQKLQRELILVQFETSV
jgi:hypothetical protein